MQEKGIIYHLYGSDYFSERLEVSVRFARNNTNLPICLITENKNIKNKEIFDIVIPVNNVYNSKHGFHRRANDIFKYTPFKYTLYLDIDTCIISDVSYGFDMSKVHNIALSHAPASTLEGQLKQKTLEHHNLSPYTVLYNCGVIFFCKNNITENIFEYWKKWNKILDDPNDQFGLAVAMEKLKFSPFVLPGNWNFRIKRKSQLFNGIHIMHGKPKIYKNIYFLANKKGFW